VEDSRKEEGQHFDKLSANGMGWRVTSANIAQPLLAWYDVNARALPWRSPPGADSADPYRVWLSEVMLQQTTVAAVRPRFEAWVARWPDVASLAAADDGDVMAAWAGLGYYARARTLLAAARVVVTEHGRAFPDTEAGLRALPGVGGYTAAAIAAIAFGRRAVVVDANVERVVARLFALETPLPAVRPEVARLSDTIVPKARAGDFAQAMMDLGSAICTPRAPRCLLCPLRAKCLGFASGAPDRFPVRPTKRERPVRHGTMFWLERDGRVLLVRRPPRGLLGGMRALPTGLWEASPPGLTDAPAPVLWSMLGEETVHIFTHFRLESALAMGRADAQTAHADGEWWSVDALADAGLPGVFAKAAEVFRRVGCVDR
jgi:A/G-specific adenine glycosylase